MAILFYSSPRAQFFDGNGNPLSMGQVSYYFPGTTTLKEIYTDITEATPAQNPQPLDAEGYVRDGGVWLGDGLYDVLLEASDGAGGFTTEWTIPNVGMIDSTAPGAIGNIAYIETIQDLVNLDTSAYSAAYVFGYYAKGDGGDGWFYFDAASTVADDGGAVIAPLGAPATGRWFRIFADDKISCTKWGATENAPGSVNSNLTNWTNYANDLDAECTLHIPPGIYTVVPGSITVQQSIHIDNGVTFNVNGPGAYTFTIDGRFEINTLSKITDASSQGSCNLDFTTNTFGTSDLEVRPEWYETTALTFDFCGALYVLISQTTVVSLVSNKTGSLRFRGNGTLDTSGSTLTVPHLDVGDPGIQRFTHSLGNPFPNCVFEDGNVIYTASFESLEHLVACAQIGTFIYVNNTATVGNGQTINLSAAASITYSGFWISVFTGGSLLTPNIVGNQVLKAEGGSITNTANIYDRYSFVIDSQASFDGYVDTALQNNFNIDFKDLTVAFNLDLSGITQCSIRNLYTAGGVTADGTVTFTNCSISGANTVASAALVFKNSQVDSDLSCTLFRASDTGITSEIVANTMDVTDCIVSGDLVPTDNGGSYDFLIKDNSFEGGYIKPNGNALSTRAYILNNDFQFPSSENPVSFLYVPIDGFNFLVTGETFTASAVNFPVAYNVRVADNTPAWGLGDTPTVGTKVLQTVRHRQDITPISTAPGAFVIKPGVNMLAPYIADGMVYASMDATIMYQNSSNLSVTPANVVTFNAVRSDYEVLYSTTGAASDIGGVSATLDLYPQRAL